MISFLLLEIDQATISSAAGPGPPAPGQGHWLALKLATIRRAREVGARRLVADTSLGNVAMLTLNQRLGYVAALDGRNLEGTP
jgi:hypothetical protein